MKYLTILFSLILFMMISVSVPRVRYAQEDQDEIKDKINDLKDRLATKVAELREQNKRSFYGVIKNLGESSMTLLYRDQEMPVAFDDDSTFFSISSANKRSGADKDVFELGETVVVFGTLDLDDKTIISTYLYQQQPPLINYGTVVEVDENDGSFVIDSNTGNIILDYKISTQCTWMLEDKKERCGLSKITPGDRVFLRLEPDDEGISRATILRVLLVPQETETETLPQDI